MSNYHMQIIWVLYAMIQNLNLNIFKDIIHILLLRISNWSNHFSSAEFLLIILKVYVDFFVEIANQEKLFHLKSQ